MQLKRGCRGSWIALLAVAADGASKAAVQASPGSGRTLLGLIRLSYATNTGMAFSMFSGQSLLLTLATAALIIGLIAWQMAKPDHSALFRAGLWLIVGGGLGNLYDRVFHGRVIDFLELTFIRFPIFNVADVCICAGAALAMLGAILEDRRQKSTP